MKRERWQTKSDGEGASAAEAKWRRSRRERSKRVTFACRQLPNLYEYIASSFGVDFPDETGKMSQSDKRGTLRGESGGLAADRG